MKYFYLKKFIKDSEIPVSVRNSSQGENADPHMHDYVEIVFVYAGHAIHQRHGKQQDKILSNSVIKGDIFTVLPGEIHSYRGCHNFRIYNLCIARDFLFSLSPELNKLEYFEKFFNSSRGIQVSQLHLMPMDFLEVEDIIKKIVLTLHLHPSRQSRLLTVQIILLNLLVTIFDGVFKGWKQYPACIDQKLFLSIEQLEAFPVRKWDLAKLSREVGMSLSSYAHKFKDIVGVPPVEYITMLRLELARKQLEKTSLSLFEVASATGFTEDNYLIRLFKKRYGITPKRYRMLYKCPADPV